MTILVEEEMKAQVIANMPIFPKNFSVTYQTVSFHAVAFATKGFSRCGADCHLLSIFSAYISL